MPEALLSDRGTNLLSHLMKDLCEMLGIRQLNTTAYHPATVWLSGSTALLKPCYGNMLRGLVTSGINISLESSGLTGMCLIYSTKEKPSYLLYGLDLRTPTKAAFLSSTRHQLTDVSDYREELKHLPESLLQLVSGKPNRTTNAVMTRKLPRISGSGLETGCSSTSL